MKNKNLNDGTQKVEWALNFMPMLNIIKDEFIKDKPFKNMNISMALHIEAKTAALAYILSLGGAKVFITGCNPLSTKMEIVSYLNSIPNITCYGKYGCSIEEYYDSLNKVLDCEPNIVIDDGADLISILHNEREELIENINGCCEETTTGVHRIKSLYLSKKLKVGVFAVNNSKTKYLFDNRYGTGQSVLNSIMSSTNILIAGKNIIICGYGWCGKGVALRAKGLGGIVYITEVDPHKAIEANMDGYNVISMDIASRIGDIFITTTGNYNIINSNHFINMKNGCILANAGHFNVEINVPSLESLSTSKKNVRENIMEYNINKKKIYLLAEGRLVNLAAGDGHPIEVMDLSFANQALCSKYLTSNKLEIGIHDVPYSIDKLIASMKLNSMNINIDVLSEDQINYLNSWNSGTL